MYLLQQQELLKVNGKNKTVWVDIEDHLDLHDIVGLNKYLMDKRIKGNFRVLSLCQRPTVFNKE